MKKISWGALLLVALGLLVALTPYFLFPVCEARIPTASGGGVPMKCFWTARVSLAWAAMIVVSGVLLLFAKNPGLRLGLGLSALCAGLMTMLTPNAFIGVCPGEMMPCHMGTLPALSLFGLLTVAAAAGVALSAFKSMKSHRPA